MEYSFDIHLAKEYGIDEAIMIKNFQFWIMKNKSNNKNQHEIEIEGKIEIRTFTYNSKTAFEKLFIFWNYNQIKRILKSLREKEILVTGNYNKIAYDQTLWYAFKNESEFINVQSIGHKCPMERKKKSNQMDKKAQPIPYNKPYNKPYIKEDRKKNKNPLEEKKKKGTISEEYMKYLEELPMNDLIYKVENQKVKLKQKHENTDIYICFKKKLIYVNGREFDNIQGFLDNDYANVKIKNEVYLLNNEFEKDNNVEKLILSLEAIKQMKEKQESK